jgi:hypothetical protein
MAGSNWDAAWAVAGRRCRELGAFPKRIILRDHWSPRVLAFVVVMLVVLFVLIPAIINHPHPRHH